MSAVDEIKDRLDIVAYIQQSVPIKKAGRYYKACCPFHAEKTPSFVVNPETQSWRCFGACAEGGDIFSFAMKQHGWSFVEALEELGKAAGVEVRPQSLRGKTRADERDKLRGLMQVIAEFYHERLLDGERPEAAAALRYTREKRGFSDETIRAFGIGYAPPGWQNALEHLTHLGYGEDQIIEVGMAIRSDSGRVYDRFRNRLMIPIRDERGRVVAFGARALAADDEPKYLNSPHTPLFDKSKALFGLDAARSAIRDSETVVIVEGYMDAMQAHQAGFTNVVAQMGTALAEPQLKRLVRHAAKIVLALDADAAGQNATRRSLEVARQTLEADYAGRMAVDIRILQIPNAKDPDDYLRETPEAWPALVESALPVADYVIDMEVATLPEAATVQQREAVARRLLPILLASENNLYQKDNLQKLALRLRIPERELLMWAQEQERIAKSRLPRRPAVEFPPDLPPLDYETLEMPDDDVDGDSVAPVHHPARKSLFADARLEADCLRDLFVRPERLYKINHKLRQLADQNEALLKGSLRAFSAGDFSDSTCRTLMLAFQASLSQDDVELLEFVRANLDLHLQGELRAILMDEIDSLRPKLRHGLSADLSAYLKHQARFDGQADHDREFVRKALRLRAQRLQREREELFFMQMDGQADDAEAGLDHGALLLLSIQAKGLIEAELQRQSHPTRA